MEKVKLKQFGLSCPECEDGKHENCVADKSSMFFSKKEHVKQCYCASTEHEKLRRRYARDIPDDAKTKVESVPKEKGGD